MSPLRIPYSPAARVRAGLLARGWEGRRPTRTVRAQMMRDPKFMESMASACAQSMKDPAVLRNMQEALDNAEMRQRMQKMLEMMQRR